MTWRRVKVCYEKNVAQPYYVAIFVVYVTHSVLYNAQDYLFRGKHEI